ncbi:MAG: hypothetical protein IPI58_00815 [Alphaproteobacteria bacterium]|nr:MAG: hypothetical protein IPI58_00815 [Alphaproteobacteria bacterium]
MLGSVALNYETPLVWMPFVMPSTSKTPVEMIDNGFGEETVVYRVGQKMMYITMGEDFARDDLFITTIPNVYVKDLEKRRGYLYPASFETDAKTGQYLEVSPEDEKLLIDQLVKDQLTGVEYRKQKDMRPIKQRIVGSYYSAEDQVVYKNPSSPKTPPKTRRDKRFDQ